MGTYFLFENATGYYLFLKKESEDFGIKLKHVQQSILESKRFRKMIKLVGHLAFETAAQALENIAEISTGSFTETAAEFLQTSIPKLRKAKLAVEDARLPSSISEFLPKLKCEKNEVTDEIFRGIRLHFLKLISGIEHRDLSKAQLGLAHAFSRNKVAHDVNRADKPIIQAIALIDQLDKDINTFAMRIKEWYSWHFPELKAIVTDNILYARTVSFIKNKESLEGDIMEELTELVESEEIAQQIIDASKISMGQEFSDIDYAQIGLFTNQAVSLADYRKHIADYLKDRMDNVAPNLAALIGEVVGARLISQAGGLVNLAKYPSSTLQILGAEKALFRALKTRGNTPKYGIIYHSSFIGKAGQKNKGRISRFLANKCSIASRIDSFFPSITNAFGEKMREQVEERLEYFDTGERGAPNDEVMEEVLKSLKPKKKRKHSS